MKLPVPIYEHEINRVIPILSIFQQPIKIGRKFLFFSFPKFRNPETSPIFLPPDTSFNERDLKSLVAYFESNPPQSTTDRRQAYFNVLIGPSTKNLKQLCRDVISKGWSLEEKRMAVNFWMNPISLTLPETFSVSVGDHTIPKLRADYINLTSRMFPFTPQEVIEPLEIASSENIPVKLSVIYDQHQQACASSAVIVKQGYAIIFSVAVDSDYRGRGLWRSLLSSQQFVSKGVGSSIWLLTTDNPRLAKKCDVHFEILTFTSVSD